MERAKAFISRLADFADVEAESRAFEIAAQHKDFQRGLTFLMDWPAVAEAGRMIEARPDDINVTAEQTDFWAPRLRRTKPRAAHLLLRKAAADAFRRREFATCDRLTEEAEAIVLPDLESTGRLLAFDGPRPHGDRVALLLKRRDAVFPDMPRGSRHQIGRARRDLQRHPLPAVADLAAKPERAKRQ